MAFWYDPYAENSLCKITHVSFGIFGDGLNSDELTDRICVKPSRALSKGQPIPRPEQAGGGFYPASTGVWQIRSDAAVQSTSTEEHAEYVLETLEPHAHVIQEFLNRVEYSVVVSIWWETDQGHGGYSLRASTTSRLCRLCDRVDTHFLGGVYPEGDDKERE